MSISQVKVRLAPQTGTGLKLYSGQTLEIIDPTGGQVADLALFSADDIRERLSPGRTIDYNENIALTTGSALYSVGFALIPVVTEIWPALCSNLEFNPTILNRH
jgi:uncharacterized protein YcgI (DUF1989 family)